MVTVAEIVAPFDAYLNTPNKSIRQNVPRKGVCLHHAAMTSLSGLESLAMGGKQVSATAIVKDRVSKQLMTDEFRAWSLSSAWGDSSFRSVETCNQSTDGYTISDESHWELAFLVAFWALRDGFWPHRDGDPKSWTVVGHREMYTIWDVSYATACPGGMDLDLVTKRAQGLLLGASQPVKARRTAMWNLYTRDDNLAIAFGWSDALDPIMKRAWIELPPAALVESALYSPVRIDNKTWNHRSNAADRLPSVVELNKALVAAGRPALYSAAASAAGGGATAAEVARIVAEQLATLRLPTKGSITLS